MAVLLSWLQYDKAPDLVWATLISSQQLQEKPRLRLTVPLTARDRRSEHGTTVAVFSGLLLFFIESVFVEQLTNLSHQPVWSKRFLKERYPFGEHAVMNGGLFCVA